MAHTPGPWKYGNWTPNIVNLSGWIDIWATDEDGGKTLPFAACKHINEEANARLIAAAPTMYAFIEKKAEDGDEEAKKLIGAIHATL